MITDAMRDRLDDDQNEQRALADEANGPSDKDLLLKLYDTARTLSANAVLVETTSKDGKDSEVHFKVEEGNITDLDDVLTEIRNHIARTDGIWLSPVI